MSVGSRLRRLRTAQGLSQHGLSRASGVSQSAISKLESGISQVFTHDLVERLAVGLGLADPGHLSYGTLSEITGCLALGDEEGAIVCAFEAFTDLAAARLETHADAMLDALDPARLPAGVILASLMASGFRKGGTSFRRFLERSRASLAARYGDSAARQILAGL